MINFTSVQRPGACFRRIAAAMQQEFELKRLRVARPYA